MYLLQNFCMKKAILPCLVFIAFAMTSCSKDASAPVVQSKNTSEAKTTVSDTQRPDQESNNRCGNHSENNPNRGY